MNTCMANIAWWQLPPISPTVCAKSTTMCIELCHWLHTNRQLLPLILFTDEATFTHNGINNTCNLHQWSHDNPHGPAETSFQRHFSIDVRCSMINDMLIGPVILDGCTIGHNYLDFPQHGLLDQPEDVPLATWIAMYFQHDGAPSHFTLLVMQHLNDTFPNWWISCGSTINGPPRSADLMPLDFWLWGWMKSKVYRRKADTPDELLHHIMDVITRIKEHQNALRWATRHVLTRVAKCTDVGSEIFENVLQ
jgi:hypothetical protein